MIYLDNAATTKPNLAALEKAKAEKAKELGLKNILFVKTSAEYLPRILRENSVTELYLNFSCPYPKSTYATHRLTNRRFLKIYDRLLCEGAEIHQKTDALFG